MEWKTDGTARKKALKFKEDYERLFQEMTGSMESLAGEVVGYLKRENLWDDQEAVLNVISVLPGCWFRFRLYSRYYEIADKPHKVVTNPECKVWKADREILRKVQDFAEDYEEKEKRLLQMEADAEKELTDYLKRTGLWDDWEAVHEMRCCLPICLVREKLDGRYYELWNKKKNSDR